MPWFKSIEINKRVERKSRKFVEKIESHGISPLPPLALARGPVYVQPLEVSS